MLNDQRLIWGRQRLIICLLLLCFVLGTSAAAAAQQERNNYTVGELAVCELNTIELSELVGPDGALEPCIFADVNPVGISNQSSPVITMVQVTPTSCTQNREGSYRGILELNADNDGKGVTIGFKEDNFLKFRFVSVVAGNMNNMTTEEYQYRHEQLLRSLLETYKPQYIVGTCSFVADVEKAPALDYKTILMAQVGPPSFYTDDNPYVFGIHINSDNYPLPAVRELGFTIAEKNQDPSDFPVTVIYRTKSEFFYSTCRSAIDSLLASGFTNVKEIIYDHDADEDGNGVINEFDDIFLEGLADEACPPGSGLIENFHPALFICTRTEQDTILRRLQQNGCRPTSLWLTASTWGWANSNLDLVPYFQGGGQWHEAMTYSDNYFSSGLELLLDVESKTGYLGGYDMIGSYVVPVLFAQHLHAAYRVEDHPDPLGDFQDDTKREQLRRALIMLYADTLFGPVSFDENQRNNGRGAAGTQWLPLVSDLYENALVSPSEQAEARVAIPAFSALPCDAGSFVNTTLWMEESSILSGGCALCPMDTFSAQPNEQNSCNVCPGGSSTEDMDGQLACIARDEQFIPNGLIFFAYAVVAITWAYSLACLCWIINFRDDPIVKIAQFEFLAMTCVGALITPSTVIALSFQAGTNDDTTIPSLGCAFAPYLYTVGWIFQYVSLSAKTYRLYKVMANDTGYQRKTVSFLQTLPVVLIALFVDLTIVTSMTILNTPEYVRSEIGTSVDEESGVITIMSVGQCVLEGDVNAFAYVGPLFCHHLLLLIGTNVLLYKVRNINDRYQEQKYFALASAIVFELFVIGLPVIISVGDSPTTKFAVVVGIINLDSLSMLGFIFLPKMNFQKKGLEEGVGVVESIRKETSKKAETRENLKKQMKLISSNGPSHSQLPSVMEGDEEGSSESMRAKNEKNGNVEVFVDEGVRHDSMSSQISGSSDAATSSNKSSLQRIEVSLPKDSWCFMGSSETNMSQSNISQSNLVNDSKPSETTSLPQSSKNVKDSWCSMNLSEQEESQQFNLLPALDMEEASVASTNTFGSSKDRGSAIARTTWSQGQDQVRNGSSTTVCSSIPSPSPSVDEKVSDFVFPLERSRQGSDKSIDKSMKTYEIFAGKKTGKGRDSWHNLALSGLSGLESTDGSMEMPSGESETYLPTMDEGEYYFY